MSFPLPFTCVHLAYVPDVVDAYGNPVPKWSDGVEVACIWWVEGEPSRTMLVVDSSLPVDYRDHFDVGGRRYEIADRPTNFEHGPFGFFPNRVSVELVMLDWTNSDA